MTRRRLYLRSLLLVLQWVVLLAVAGLLATRFWYEHPLVWLVAAVCAVLLWAPELRRGARRWWFVYVVGILIYSVLRSDADSLGIAARSDYVIAVDRFVFHGAEPVVWLQARLFSPTHVGAVAWFATQIHWSFFIAPHAIAAAVYIWRREVFGRYVALMLGVMYVGLLFFFLVPTTPPWLAAQRGALEPVYRVMDFVGTSMDNSMDFETYRTLYRALGEPNSVAAMPSIHMGVTFAGMLWVRRYFPRFALPYSIYTVLMAVSLVFLAEHYVLDLVVGMLSALVVDFLVERIARRMASYASTPAAVSPL